jgi:methylthioribose-1-phosphate isomerase
MDIQTVRWHNQAIKIIDQTKLPLKLKYIYIKDLKTLWKAIKILQVRGAPALGAVAGLGVYLGVKDLKADNFLKFKKEFDKVVSYIGLARPTARNLFWGLERMRSTLLKNKHRPVSSIKNLLFEEAQKIIQEDRIACRKIGEYGAKLIKDKDAILTICNAGILATIDYGTALGVIYRAKEEGKDLKIFVCETRPLLQGARLTSWELKTKGIDVTLICDNMAATLMSKNKITKVIAGADRIAANGDTANKIGTYNLAVLSHYHKIPFYIAAPSSTFDLSIKNGNQIPIEERDPKEITELFFKQPIVLKNIRVFNPAFDITPHYLISAIITDKGIIRPPYLKNIRRLLNK